MNAVPITIRTNAKMLKKPVYGQTIAMFPQHSPVNHLDHQMLELNFEKYRVPTYLAAILHLA